jgi:hypothetical protein
MNNINRILLSGVSLVVSLINRVSLAIIGCAAYRLMPLRFDGAFVAEDHPGYSFDGNNITAGDRRLRQDFTTTIGLRQRTGS